MPTALVTGSARRVGKAIAQALIANDWQVIIHSRDASIAQKTAREIGASHSFSADLSNPAEIEELANNIKNATPNGLALLINSASSFEQVTAWQEATLESWDKAFNVNTRAPYLLTVALLPLLKKVNGSVINISDLAAHEHWSSFPLHAASKAALESLTISGAKALKKYGIKVNAIVPGNVLPPDSWSPERIAAAHEASRIQPLSLLTEKVVELATDSETTGSIAHL